MPTPQTGEAAAKSTPGTAATKQASKAAIAKAFDSKLPTNKERVKNWQQEVGTAKIAGQTSPTKPIVNRAANRITKSPPKLRPTPAKQEEEKAAKDDANKSAPSSPQQEKPKPTAVPKSPNGKKPPVSAVQIRLAQAILGPSVRPSERLRRLSEARKEREAREEKKALVLAKAQADAEAAAAKAALVEKKEAAAREAAAKVAAAKAAAVKIRKEKVSSESRAKARERSSRPPQRSQEEPIPSEYRHSGTHTLARSRSYTRTRNDRSPPRIFAPSVEDWLVDIDKGSRNNKSNRINGKPRDYEDRAVSDYTTNRRQVRRDHGRRDAYRSDGSIAQAERPARARANERRYSRSASSITSSYIGAADDEIRNFRATTTEDRKSLQRAAKPTIKHPRFATPAVERTIRESSLGTDLATEEDESYESHSALTFSDDESDNLTSISRRRPRPDSPVQAKRTIFGQAARLFKRPEQRFEPSRAVPAGPTRAPTIESWLDRTPDPFRENQSEIRDATKSNTKTRVNRASYRLMQTISNADSLDRVMDTEGVVDDQSIDSISTPPELESGSKKRRARRVIKHRDGTVTIDDDDLGTEDQGHHDMSSLDSRKDGVDNGKLRSPGRKSSSTNIVSRRVRVVSSRTATSPPTPVKTRRSENSRTKRSARHSDLMSVLSEPNPTGTSIRSARSAKTSRPRFNKGTTDGLLKIFARDESVYTRELFTLVDGVVPVLITSVLSRTKDAEEAGRPGKAANKDKSVTGSKFIFEMGLALEKLQTQHEKNKVSTQESVCRWASDALPVYADYIRAWRLDFEDVVINLAPKDGLTKDHSSHRGMPLNSSGDVINDNGERVDVAFLLKRPLVRLKQIAKTLNNLQTISPSDEVSRTSALAEKLVQDARSKLREERARIEDEAAAGLDTSKTRDVRTLMPMDGIIIPQKRRVKARDSFALHLLHSSGQRMDCKVELFVREDPPNLGKGLDLLVAQVDGTGRWLLFPPCDIDHISSRLGESKGEIVVMIRGKTSKQSTWSEVISLTAEDEQISSDWVNMLGLEPVPPAIRDDGSSITFDLSALTESSRPRTGQMDRWESPSVETQDSEATWQDPRSGESRFVKVSPKRDVLTSRIKPRPILHNPSTILEETTSALAAADDPTTRITGSRFGSTQRNATQTPTKSSRSENDRKPSSLPLTTSTRASGSPSNQPVLHRRTSSPLKKEYEPSETSESDIGSDMSEVVHDVSSMSSSSDSEFEEKGRHAVLVPMAAVRRYRKAPRTLGSESLAEDTLSPSQSASQAPYREVPAQYGDAARSLAMISYWSSKGAWEKLWPDSCVVIVSPGLIEAYEPDGELSRQISSQSAAKLRTSRPLIGLELTPLVPIRRGTLLDISVRSPPTSDSKLTVSTNNNFLFRSQTPEECEILYNLINQARINNPTYIALQNARATSFGAQIELDDRKQVSKTSKISAWFDLTKRKGYRASSAPSPSISRHTESSGGSLGSALTALKGLNWNSSRFNLAKSTILSRNDGRGAGLYTSGNGAPGAALEPADGVLGLNNCQIRLYLRESNSKWNDLGAARLTIMRQTTSMNIADPGTSALRASGMALPIEHVANENTGKFGQSTTGTAAYTSPGNKISTNDKRILVTAIPKDKEKTPANEEPKTLLDATLSETCFERVARTGIAVSVWENFEGGMVAKEGGVFGGRLRIYMMQFKNEADTAYTYSIVGKLRY